MTPPKLFISYSWSSPEHEEWVLQLATDLRESGIDAILDKWDLKEGHDAHSFMERMITDPDIKKVILICDKVYAEKADKRAGGVGTEAQIMSADIYGKQDQEKFVAILRERDETGKAYLPIYYKSRMYIDFSEDEHYASSMEQLVRCIYEKPQYKKPEIGQKPSYIEHETPILSTSFQYKRALDAIRNPKRSSIATINEYLILFSNELENMRVISSDKISDDNVIESIENFIPYRNELIEILITLSTHMDSEETRLSIHRFLESLIKYLSCPPNVSSYTSWSFDNYKFIIHEIFLYTIAIFVKHERFETANYLMKNNYFSRARSNRGRNPMNGYTEFYHDIESIEARNSRLNLRKLSLRADLLHQRNKGTGIDFHYIMQADFILFIRSHLKPEDSGYTWYPESLIYAFIDDSAFEIFARSNNAEYFEKVKPLLGIKEKTELGILLDRFDANPSLVPRSGFRSYSPRNLLAYEKLSTK